MKIALVGCGFVADQYMSTLAQCEDLTLVCAYDRLPERTRAFCAHYGVRPCDSLDELLADPEVEMVLNLTNPRSHVEVTTRCFEAGKHVYSEKPIGMDVASAERLVRMAEAHGVRLASAPCNMLGRTAQTVWKAVEDGAIGKPLLVYATFDAGYIAPYERPWTWKSKTGAHWPAKDEFEVGCTYEHAGYLLTCMMAMFGPVKAVTGFAACQIPDKGIPVDGMAPDFTVGCLEFDRSPVVARVTCGVVAPREKSFLLVGDEGVLTVGSFRDDTAPVHWTRHRKSTNVDTVLEEIGRGVRSLLPFLPWGPSQRFRFWRRYPHAIEPPKRVVNMKKRVDFSLGPQEFAAAIREDRPCRLDGRVGVHVVELIHALQYPDPANSRRIIHSRFDPIAPLPWIR